MTPEQIASAFRNARLSATPLSAYPGDDVPANLEAAYAIQEQAIRAWPDRLAGWKVAMIQPAWREQYPAERLAGPVFEKKFIHAAAQAVDAPVVENGYAAVEVEFVLKIGRTIPHTGNFDDAAQLRPYVDAVYGAFEIAGSPLAGLNTLGPGAVISDFGNNTAIVVGPALPLSVLDDLSSIVTTAEINGVEVGRGDASRIPGGPLGALLFLVRQLASRGRSLQPGALVSTGASTGIHVVKVGDKAKATFGGVHTLEAQITAARG
jgi:2-keto-4-pentenoate hydratase